MDETHSTTVRVRSRRRTESRETATLPGPAHLVVLVGPEAGRLIPIDEQVELGRDVPGIGLLEDDGVSRRHARIAKVEDGYRLNDLGSRNGTYLNGARVEESSLHTGDKIAVGARTILLFTRYGRYEEHILQQQKMQALGQLAGGVAHDFNNLLGAILGNVSYLGSGDRSPEEYEDCLAEVEMAARRAAELTSRLLTFARKRELTLEAVSVNELIEESTALLRRALSRELTIETHVQSDLHVMGDGSQLLQVLMNAGINAGHAMQSGGRIDVRVDSVLVARGTDTGRAELTPGRYVRIELADTGKGMDRDTLDQVFQPFFSTKPEGEGTGLGMATAQSVVREHGGDIDIASELGEGSRVRVYLPAAEPSRPGDAAENTRLGPLTGTAILADDELLVRRTAQRLLRGFGMEADVAAEGTDVLPRILSGEYDLAILSDDLRSVSTDKIVEMARQRTPRTRFIVTSSRHRVRRREVLDELGVQNFLRKPFDAKALHHAVRSALRLGHTPTSSGDG